MIKKVKNKILLSRGGKIFKYVDKKKSYFKNFGEVYVNFLNSNKKIDWIFHKKCQCLILVVQGKIKFITKKKNNKINNFILSSKRNHLFVIPPKTWFRFYSISSKSIFLNLINKIHNPREVLRKKIS